MAAFASLDDLAAYLDVPIPPDDPTALQALEFASAAIRAYTRQTIEAVDGDTITLRGFDRPALLLPELPVNAVGFVMVGDTPLTADSDYVWDASGVLWRNGSSWGAHDPVRVTYSHGYETIPDPIRSVCVQVAARTYTNPEAVASETIGNYSVSFGSSAAPTASLSDMERAMLDGYRFRGLA